MKWKSFLLIYLILNTCAFSSNDVVNTLTLNTVSQNTAIKSSHIDMAKDWSLSDAEWKQYLTLMQGPSGHYYQMLSPSDVLGINAETSEELRHYAEISAKFEHDKLERELRFNSAFHEAAARLYSAEPIIKPFDYTPFTPIPKD